MATLLCPSRVSACAVASPVIPAPTMAMSADSGTRPTVHRPAWGQSPQTGTVPDCAAGPIVEHLLFGLVFGTFRPDRAHVRLRLLLLRVQGRVPRPVAGVLESRQDRLLAGRRSRSGHRPARGLLLLGHGRPPADRPAPERRDVQPRPSQPR